MNLRALINRAFSLIELMIVITIIGILAAVAVPSYQTYVIKAKIATVMPILDAAMKQIIEGHNINGSFPSTISSPGGTLSSGGGIVAQGLENVAFMFYYAPNTTTAYTCVDFSANVGIPGMVVGTGNNGTDNRICNRVVFSNNSYQRYCGGWNSAVSNEDIPIQYAPGGCTCTNIGGGTC